MAPASSSLLPDSSRLKWKKRKRESNLGGGSSSFKKHKARDDDDEDDDDEDANAEEDDHDAHPHADPVLDARDTEVLSDGAQRVSAFPAVVRRPVNRPHRSVLALVAAERSPADGRPRPAIENISHGQLQSLSAVLPDHPALNCPAADEEKPPAYASAPPLLGGRGVAKQFAGDRVLVVPTHSADWFHPNTVHRLERQVVPHFFSGKSKSYAPERYLALRNMVVAKYLENPGRRLSFEDCQSFVSGSDATHDLNRIVRFLDNWGIINYSAGAECPPPSASSTPLIREEANGELQVVTAPLKLIDSLVQFDRPRSHFLPENVPSSCVSARGGSDLESPDLDSRIRKRMPEYCCSYCSNPLLRAHYQSLKEADTILCSECYHDAKFIIGHSSIDFVRTDLRKGSCDIDGGDNWTDQETFLLLEALEKYHDNWNEIADYVGTKSKSQCFLHFIRLPVEDGMLENLHFPSVSSNTSKDDDSEKPDVRSNGCYTAHTESCEDDNTENRLPFSSAANPVMALVAFLASAIGPRVAATCANAALTFLTNENGKEDLVNSEGTCTETDTAAGHATSGRRECQGLNGKSDPACALSADRVKLAAMCGLSAAAVKAKLFADQEEREIQRLTATIINHQLKRLELKLKQFAEVETLLLKECEQVERSRQSILAERTRMLSSRFSLAGMGSNVGAAQMAAGGPLPMPVSMSGEAPAMSTASTGTRQVGLPMGGGQTSLSSVGAHAKLPQSYGNNVPTHPHMPFMARQPMFPFVGPRLPLSAIHPPSSQAAIAMLSSGTSSSPVSSQRPLLRSSSGNNHSLG